MSTTTWSDGRNAGSTPSFPAAPSTGYPSRLSSTGGVPPTDNLGTAVQIATEVFFTRSSQFEREKALWGREKARLEAQLIAADKAKAEERKASDKAAAKALAEERKAAAKALAEEREASDKAAAKALAEERKASAKALAEERKAAANVLAEEREVADQAAAAERARLQAIIAALKASKH
jgi:hypothetical protein